MRPVPGQGLICFKCGKSHRASECNFFGTCRVCGRDGHMGLVCKKNPDSIIKWQRSATSAGSGSAASSRGSAPSVNAPRGTVQMMAGPPAPYYQFPQQYFPPAGSYWQAPQLLAPHVPLQLPAPSAPPA
ncbi:hypothetical protein PVAP13_8NG183304 [Panicum virgatum]|uniref:CCHC-type domain-containing protein n=1 Tax=Panicum virgatum TaxID=38727 RepID=A0A8T0PF71_PANVG|nr:hypothetical protein PVAP13_8NG183304 [Panicum virgatum]